MQKNPVKQFDDLILEHNWLGARTLLLSLGPLQAAHTVLAAMVWFDRCADDRDWELFNENLAGLYPLKDIPEWCQMPGDEHHVAGGCWGILYGDIASKGRDHCGDCEYHLKPEETIVQSEGLAMFSANSDAVSALEHAGTRSGEGKAYLLSGDLGQMGTMTRVLRDAGFSIGNRDVYPAIEDLEEFKRALQYLWDHRVESWWNQKRALIRHGICTAEEYTAKLEKGLDP